MTSIILVGPRCTGKTEKGKILASLRNVPFVDADVYFENLAGQSISDFVKKFGWHQFRRAEAQTLATIYGSYHNQNFVLAPGGGAVAHNQGEDYRRLNVSILRRLGQVVYLLPTENLEESARVLTERMNIDSSSTGQRPSLTRASSQYEEMLQVLKDRDELYKKAAHHVFYTRDLTSEQVALKINDLIR